MMTLTQFYTELEKHDWFYYFSDDMKVDRAGKANQNRLGTIAIEGGKAYVDLLVAYQAYVFRGPNFNNPDAPKPAKPSEEV